MRKIKPLNGLWALMVFTIICSSFLFCVTAYAGDADNTWKPLNTWAETQIIVFNTDKDNAIHFDVSYNLDELLRNVSADAGIQLGLSNEYKNRYRAPV